LDNLHYGGQFVKGLRFVFEALLKRRSKALSGKLFGNKEMRLLMLGLDAAGKTSQYMSLIIFGCIHAESDSYPLQAET
jgi:hypothetical protein